MLIESLSDAIRDPAFRQGQIDSLRETTTHYVWAIASGVDIRICLNEYKPLSVRSDGYATSIHDHRYDFVSIILRGGFSHQKYDAHFERLDAIKEPLLISEIALSAGDLLVVRCDEFHRLSNIELDTLSLMVKLPPKKPYSTSFDVRTRAVTHHYPYVERPDQLLAKLRHPSQAEAAASSSAR